MYDPELEIKDPLLIFNKIWTDLEKKFGRKYLKFPKEIIWLGGAPGSGKGTNTDFIRRERGITAPSIVMSSLLDSPSAQRIKDRGGIVGDFEAINALFEKLLEKIYQNGVVIDGFPRTEIQVNALKLLYKKMIELRSEYQDTPHASAFPQPIFRVVVLFVDEHTSIERQLKRGREVLEHNKNVKETGIGELQEERVTDFDEELARNRYRVFKEKTYRALESLKQVFHYHFIQTDVDFQKAEENISRELQYQSSLELDQKTYDRIRGIPLAETIIMHARQELVKRLDDYALLHSELFNQITLFISGELMPVVLRHAISGRAEINTETDLLDSNLARSMLIDIFSERGYHAAIDVRKVHVPDHFDPATSQIFCIKKNVYKIGVTFQGCEIRRGH